jgi:hypothetical protein
VSKDDNWAGKGFTERNEESAPEPKPKPEPDEEEWVWK